MQNVVPFLRINRDAGPTPLIKKKGITSESWVAATNIKILTAYFGEIFRDYSIFTIEGVRFR
jgi:hypothetical protein